MVSQCFGLSQKIRSSTESNSLSTNQCSDEQDSIDYSPAYLLQKNNIGLQNNYRSMLKEIIEIFSTFSDKTNKWKRKWYGKYADEYPKITAFHKLWELFGASVAGTEDFIGRLYGSVRKLETALRSIPEPDKEQRLKTKITNAESDVSRVTKELNELKTQINELNNKSTSLRRSDIQARQAIMQTLIEQKEKSLKREQKLFREKQAELFEESKNDEIQLCEKLKKQSLAFVKALDINPEGFAELLEECNPENEFTQWEKVHFRQYVEQLDRSQSNESDIRNKKYRNTTDISTEEE